MSVLHSEHVCGDMQGQKQGQKQILSHPHQSVYTYTYIYIYSMYTVYSMYVYFFVLFFYYVIVDKINLKLHFYAARNLQSN